MALQEKIVTDTLQKLGDRIAAQKNEGATEAVPPAEHGLSPEQKKAFQDRLRDGEHLLLDLQERIAAASAEMEKHAGTLRTECRHAEEQLAMLREFSGKTESIRLPADEEPDLARLADVMHELGSLRVQWAAMDARLKQFTQNDRNSGKNGTAVLSFPLKKVFIAFGLILFGCTVLLATVIFVAWKVPF